MVPRNTLTLRFHTDFFTGKRENKTKLNEKPNLITVFCFYCERKYKCNFFFPTRIYVIKPPYNMADSNCNILWKSERVYRCHFFFAFYFIHLNMCAIEAFDCVHSVNETIGSTMRVYWSMVVYIISQIEKFVL